MAMNQSLVRDLTIDDTAAALLVGGEGKISFIREFKDFFEFIVDNTLVADGVSVIPAKGTDAYWVRTEHEIPGIKVNKVAHGLVPGNPVTSGGEKAQSNVSSTLSVGVVSEVVDVDNYIYTTSGNVSLEAGDWTAISDDAEDLQVGEFYYTSPLVAGNVTKITPSSPNFDNPIGYAVSATKLVVMPYRPSAVAADAPINDDVEKEINSAIDLANGATIDFGTYADITALSADFESLRIEMRANVTTGTVNRGVITVEVRLTDLQLEDDIQCIVSGANYAVLSLDGVLTHFTYNSGGVYTFASIRIIGVKKQINVISPKQVVVETVGLTEGDTLQWDATNSKLIKATSTFVDDSSTAGTLVQTAGTAWVVTNGAGNPPGASDFNLDSVNYVQHGNIRYYDVIFYIDNDSAIRFGVNGAVDVANAAVNGSSIATGDFASRMVNFTRTAQNELLMDRDNDSDVDMRVNLSFIAFMA